ncbi:5-oxoprolinase subunit PxpB [Anaerococcus nagyae]|uniref:5-oxoprolinase subunit PxpB n=1 Tax=Anaerococcus nagyae TaxID=1755241 RepID=UPI003255C00A
MENIKYLPSGDSALVMEFGNEISKEINASISQVVNYLKDERLNGIVDILPTYRSILINYDPRVFTFDELVEKLDSIEIADTNLSDGNVRLIEIPTLYGGEYGPDISNVAENAGLSEDEVIKIHAGVDYLVYMMGFLPGFTYLGGLDERIATPRLSSPRLKIVPGSVGIAGTQTGMYPLESPGGWQLIGRTPVKLYDPSNPESPVFINAGDYIRYVSVDEQTYNKILEEVNAGTYKVNIKEVKRGELRG